MDGLGFTGERRLLNIQVGGLDEGCVRTHGVALGQEKHVAGNQVMGGDGLLFTVTHHGGIRGGHFRQSSHRVGGFRLLGVPQNSVSDHDDGDDNNINGRASGPLYDPDTQGNSHGNKQQVDEGSWNWRRNLRHCGSVFARVADWARSAPAGRQPRRR